MMEDHVLGPELIFAKSIQLLRELGRIENKVCVYLAYDSKREKLAGVTIFLEQPEDWIEEKTLAKKAMHLARLSDFGSQSKQRLGHHGGQVYYGAHGFEWGVWFKEWFIVPGLIENPWPFRKDRPNDFSTKTRKKLLQMAQHRCQSCNATEQLEVDHIVPVAFQGKDTPENGIVLCQSCHRAKTNIQLRCKLLPHPVIDIPNTPARYEYRIDRQILRSHAPVYISTRSPYYLKFFDREPLIFESERELWLWIARKAQELIQALP